MPAINIVGKLMYYVDWGQGMPIVLMHSYLANTFMWTPQILALEKNFRVIAPDLWGHGSSDALPEGTNDLSALAQHVLSLLDNLGVEKFVLVGQSVGGMLAAEIALASPRRVAALALMGTYLGNEPDDSKGRFLALIGRVEECGIFSTDLINEIEALFFETRDHESISRLQKSFRNELSTMTTSRIRESIAPIGRMIFNRRDLRHQFSELDSISTVVICGEHDTVRPPKESKEMAKLIGCQYIEVPDASHTSNLENPDFVTNALVDFINRSLLSTTMY